ncbi:MAG: hypothetical protein IT353_22750 [Gemmatimonadaceae bacterium]|nr:hypothetical protein [Gemmatimonadaceae bacterium]
MQYTVQHRGVPMGRVELTAGELRAGTMTAAAGYAAIRQTVREASMVLLQLGFYGAASRDIDAPDASASSSLAAAANLTFELRSADGAEVPTTFVNLIEPPGDARVVVLARFSHSHTRVGATRTPPSRDAVDATVPNDRETVSSVERTR